MIEKFVMSENNIPDGMLHDQDLYGISLENSILTLSFDIFLSREEYGNSDFAKKYFEYKKCHIRCRLNDKAYCEVYLKSSLNEKYRGKMQYLTLEEFVDIANKELEKSAEKRWQPWEYLYTYVSPNVNSAKIELCIHDMKYKGVNYSLCTLELETEEIEYIWE